MGWITRSVVYNTLKNSKHKSKSKSKSKSNSICEYNHEFNITSFNNHMEKISRHTAKKHKIYKSPNKSTWFGKNNLFFEIVSLFFKK